MARNTWSIYVDTNEDGTWTSDGTIAIPNDSIEIGYTSTQQKIKLANGDNAFIRPEIKYSDNPITFIWYDNGTGDINSLKTKIENYIQNNTKIKIVDHNNKSYIGRFIAIRSNWIVGLSPDIYDLEVDWEFD